MNPYQTLRRISCNAIEFKRFLVGFYCLGLYEFVFYGGREILSQNFAAADFLWPVAWMQWVPDPTRIYLVSLTMVATVVCLIAAIVRPELKLNRVAVAVGLLLVLSLRYSFGKIDHSPFGYYYFPIFFALSRFDDSVEGQKWNAQILFSVMTLFLSFYFIGGASKLAALVELRAHGYEFWDLVSGYLPRTLQIAAFQHQATAVRLDFLMRPSLFTALGFLGVLVFQLGAILPIFFFRLIRAWGIGIIVFHTTVVYLMNINFGVSMLLALLLLVFHPVKISGNREAD